MSQVRQIEHEKTKDIQREIKINPVYIMEVKEQAINDHQENHSLYYGT